MNKCFGIILVLAIFLFPGSIKAQQSDINPDIKNGYFRCGVWYGFGMIDGIDGRGSYEIRSDMDVKMEQNCYDIGYKDGRIYREKSEKEVIPDARRVF